MASKLEHMQQAAKERFTVSLGFVKDAMLEQFDRRATSTAFAARPTKISTDGVVEYFDFEFELSLFSAMNKVGHQSYGYDMIFKPAP